MSLSSVTSEETTATSLPSSTVPQNSNLVQEQLQQPTQINSNELPICPECNQYITKNKTKKKAPSFLGHEHCALCEGHKGHLHRIPSHVVFDEAQIREFKRIFDIFDLNLNGKITPGELTAVLHSFGQDPTEEDVDRMIKMVDCDDNGSIEFPELLQLLTMNYKEEKENDEYYEQIFGILDCDGDGRISREDLSCVVSALGFNARYSHHDLAEMFTEADKDGDGTIDYEEFLRILKSRTVY